MAKTNLITTILANRGFNSAKVNSKDVDIEIVKEWHKMLDELHSIAYSEIATRFNKSLETTENTTTNVSIKFFDTMRKIYAYVGTINGATLKCDANTASVILAKSVCEKNRKSADLQYKLSQKSNSVRYLKELESANGTCEETIEKVKSDIAKLEEEIVDLKSIAFNSYKTFAKCSASAFYKSVEDYLADMIEKRLCLTEEEVKAEEEAKRIARRQRTAQKKAQKAAK